MHSYFGFGAFVLIIAAYLIPLVRRTSRPIRNPADFFLSQQEHDDSEFSATQTAYLLKLYPERSRFTTRHNDRGAGSVASRLHPEIPAELSG